MNPYLQSLIDREFANFESEIRMPPQRQESFRPDLREPAAFNMEQREPKGLNFNLVDEDYIKQKVFEPKPEISIDLKTALSGQPIIYQPQQQSNVAAVEQILKNNKDKPFVERILNPDKYPVIKNEDGTVSTHLMAWSEIGGKYIAYPIISFDKKENKLIKQSNEDALHTAIDTNNYIEFTTPEAADLFTKTYKQASNFGQAFIDQPFKPKTELSTDEDFKTAAQRERDNWQKFTKEKFPMLYQYSLALEKSLKDAAKSTLGFIKGAQASWAEETKKQFLGLAESGIMDPEEAYRLNMELTMQRVVADKIIGDAIKSDLLKDNPQYVRSTGFKGWTEDVVSIVFPTLVQMALYKYGGGTASMLFIASQISGSQYLEQEAAGIETTRNFVSSLVNAAAQAPLEQLAMSRVMAKWVPNGTVSTATKVIIDRMGSEFLTEWIQKYPELLTQIWAKTKGVPNEQRIEMFLDGFWKATFEGIYEGSITMPFALLGVGASIQTEIDNNDRRKRAATEQPLENTSGSLKTSIESERAHKTPLQELSEKESVISEGKTVEAQTPLGIGGQQTKDIATEKSIRRHNEKVLRQQPPTAEAATPAQGPSVPPAPAVSTETVKKSPYQMLTGVRPKLKPQMQIEPPQPAIEAPTPQFEVVEQGVKPPEQIIEELKNVVPEELINKIDEVLDHPQAVDILVQSLEDQKEGTTQWGFALGFKSLLDPNTLEKMLSAEQVLRQKAEAVKESGDKSTYFYMTHQLSAFREGYELMESFLTGNAASTGNAAKKYLDGKATNEISSFLRSIQKSRDELNRRISNEETKSLEPPSIETSGPQPAIGREGGEERTQEPPEQITAEEPAGPTLVRTTELDFPREYTPEEITEIIEDEITFWKNNEKKPPESMGPGREYSQEFAEEIAEGIDGIELWQTETPAEHWFLKYEDLYYDALHPEGVEDYNELFEEAPQKKPTKEKPKKPVSKPETTAKTPLQKIEEDLKTLEQKAKKDEIDLGEIDDFKKLFNRVAKELREEGEVREAEEKAIIKKAPKIKRVQETKKTKEAPEVNIEKKGKDKTISPDLTKQEEQTLNQKEVKKYLIKEIDSAIETAKKADPDDLDHSSIPVKEMSAFTKNQFNKYGSVIIRVPKDGEFKIINTKEALQQFKKEVNKREPGKIPGTAIPSTNPSRMRISFESGEGLSYNLYKYRTRNVPIEHEKQAYDGIYYITPNYIVKSEKKPKTKRAYNEDWTPDLSYEINKVNKDLEAAEVFGEVSGLSVITKNLAHIVTKSGKNVFANINYIDHVLTLHPDAKAYLYQDENTSTIVFKDKDDEIVGLVKPLIPEGGSARNAIETDLDKLNEYISKRFNQLKLEFKKDTGKEAAEEEPVVKKEAKSNYPKKEDTGKTKYSPEELAEEDRYSRIDDPNYWLKEIEKVTSEKAEKIDVITANPLTTDQVRSALKGAHAVGVSATKPNTIWARYNPGINLTIEFVKDIKEDELSAKIGYGDKKGEDEFTSGKYFNLNIKLHELYASEETVYHELEHFYEETGIINSEDVDILKSKIQELNKSGKWDTKNKDDIGGSEDRAYFIARSIIERKSYTSSVDKIIQKIKDFIDAILKLYEIRTARSVIRDIESGKIVSDFEKNFPASDLEDTIRAGIQKAENNIEQYSRIIRDKDIEKEIDRIEQKIKVNLKRQLAARGGVRNKKKLRSPKKMLEEAYDKNIGEPLYKYFMERLPIELGKKSELIDAINKGFILDYRKDPLYLELRDETESKIREWRQWADKIAEHISSFDRAEQVRFSQVIRGGVTSAPKRYKAAFDIIDKFQELEKELQKAGLLGKDNFLRQYTKREINDLLQTIHDPQTGIDAQIAKLKKDLTPQVSVERVIRKVSEDIAERTLSEPLKSPEDVSKMLAENENRIFEALEARGFSKGEASTMISRLKKDISNIDKKQLGETYSQLSTVIERIITKEVKTTVQKVRKFKPLFMRRAKQSIRNEIQTLEGKKAAIIQKVQNHYKMSGKRYLKQAYAAIEREKGMMKKIREYVLKRPRLQKFYAIKRKNLSEEYKKQLEIIREAPFLVFKGISEETHDVELFKMFQAISENKDWAISPEAYYMYMNLTGKPALKEKYENFKKLPVTDKLGPLSGAYIDPYIWDDLNQTVVERNEMIKAWDSVMRLWKTGKVVYNPATQARNILSNTILADWAGLPSRNVHIYAMAFKDYKNKGQYWNEANKTTLFGTEWAGNEISKFLDENALLKKGSESMLARSAKMIKKAADLPGKSYQAIEQYFKLAVFINERRQGKSVKDAAKHAESFLFNYNKIPPAIRFLKRWYSPFITWSYKAIPKAAETAIRKPWKYAKLIILFKGTEYLSRSLYGEPPEEMEKEKSVLPGYMQNYILPGCFGHMRVPYKDKYNQSKYLDLTFIMPWGDVAEQWGQSRIYMRPFFPSNPLMVFAGEVGFNEVMFTGKDLTLKSDDFNEYMKKIGTQFWRQMAPSLAGSYSFNKLYSAYKGQTDWMMRDRSFTEALFDTMLGLKLRSIDYTVERERRIRELKKEIGEIEWEFTQKYMNEIVTHPTADPYESQKRADKIYKNVNKKLDKIKNKILDLQGYND